MKFSSPGKVLNHLRNNFFIYPRMSKSRDKLLKKMLSHDIDDFVKITDEVINNHNFHERIESRFNSVNLPYSAHSRRSWPVLNYYLIRKLKPEVIVETGVWHGISTCYILLALMANNIGKLTSIDLPAYSEEGGYKDLNPFDDNDIISLPRGKSPGWIIPSYLHDRWELILGKTKDKLPPLLEKLETIDFFLHDSDHSYSNMKFEFEMGYQYLSRGGIMVADNIHFNDSFQDFCKENNLTPHTYLAYIEGPNLNHPYGGIRKS